MKYNNSFIFILIFIVIISIILNNYARYQTIKLISKNASQQQIDNYIIISYMRFILSIIILTLMMIYLFYY